MTTVVAVTAGRTFSQTVSSEQVKPFVAYEIERQYSETDTAHANPTITPKLLARRSDGSEVSSFTTQAPDGNSVETTEVTDLRKNQYILFDTASKTMTTFHRPPGDLDKSIRSNQGCPAVALSAAARNGLVLGHPVAVYADPAFAPSGSTVRITAALDLDCFPMQMTESFASGAFNETVVSSVISGEPPDSLFSAPADYREVSPAERNSEHAKKYPGHSLWDPKQLAAIEARYHASR